MISGKKFQGLSLNKLSPVYGDYWSISQNSFMPSVPAKQVMP